MKSVKYITLLLLAASFYPVNSFAGQYRAQHGRIDLSDASETLTDSVIELSGEWEFYWKRFIEPDCSGNDCSGEKTYIKVPGNWNDSGNFRNGKSRPVFGYGTYRLKVALPRGGPYALWINKIRSAYRMYINGKPVSMAGNKSKTGKGYRSKIYSSVVIVNETEPEIEIVLHVSNFDYYRGG